MTSLDSAAEAAAPARVDATAKAVADSADGATNIFLGGRGFGIQSPLKSISAEARHEQLPEHHI